MSQPTPVFINPEDPVRDIYDPGPYPVPTVGEVHDFGFDRDNKMHGAWEVIGIAPDMDPTGRRYVRCYIRRA